MRFTNEMEFVKSNNFHTIHIVRDTCIDSSHASEHSIFSKQWDYVIENDQSKEELYKKLDNIIKEIRVDHFLL